MLKSLFNILLAILAAVAGTIVVMGIQAGFTLLPAGWDLVYMVAMTGLVCTWWWRWQRGPIVAALPRRAASARVIAMAAVCVNSIGVVHTHWVPLAETTVTATALRSPWSVIATVVAAGLVAPLLEEALFRGYLLSRLRRSCDTTMSVVLSAAVFAGVHSDPSRWISQFASGILLAYIVVRTGRMWLAVATHSAINLSGVIWALATMLPLPPRFDLLFPVLYTIIAGVAALELRRVLLVTRWRSASDPASQVASPVTWGLDAAG